MGAKKLTNQELPTVKNVLSSKEAMDYVGWKRTKFWDLVDKGEIRGRFDGRWKFERAELDKYIKRKTV
jgi:excisionase family DNA binding protein